MFTLYPAIDLKAGQVVRLRRGTMSDATIYADDPAEQANTFFQLGFEWLHVVDLDGAFAGAPANAGAVRKIIAATAAKVQLGGGIRTMATAASWLEAGVSRIILGSVAVKDPAFVREACRAFPERVALGIDARAGWVATDGWAQVSDVPVLDLARRFEDAGAAALIFTDIERDGMLEGANLTATRALAAGVAIPVIASGGIASVAEVTAFRQAPEGIAGAVLGRSLYEGQVDAKAALMAALGGFQQDLARLGHS